MGGVLGGVALGGAAKKIGMGGAIQNLADMGGSVAGDFAGMAVGDNLQRGKDKIMGGQGQTAWERLGAQEQAAYEQELKNQVLAEYGLLPQARQQTPGLMVRYADQGLGTGIV